MADEAPTRRATSITLRAVERADLPLLFEIQLDPEGNRLAAVIPRDAETFDAVWEKVLADRTVTARAIVADGVLCGSISCFKRDGRDYVGYWIDRTHWGRGIASRAMALLLAEVTVRPLYARVARHNAASLRVLEKCGFKVAEYRHSPATERFLACEEAQLVLA